MGTVNKQVLVAGLVVAGGAWAGTASVSYPTLTSSGLATNSGFTTTGDQLTLTNVDADFATAPTYWQRDRWESDADTTRVVQLDIAALNTTLAASQWIDTCINSRDLDGATLYDKVESVNAARWWVDTSSVDARDAFTAVSEAPGSPSSKYDNVTALRTLRSVTGAATSAVDVPDDLGFPVEVSFLTGGLRHGATAGSTANYTIVMTFGSGGSAVTRTFTIPILNATVGSTSRNGAGGTNSSSTPSEGGATAVAWHKYNWTVAAPSTTDNPACEATFTNGDEVVIDNPGLTDPALAGLALSKVSFSYTELDTTQNGGSVTAYLPGPAALSLTVDSDDYDASYRYREEGSSASSVGSVIKANAGASAAWWFAVEYDVTWPASDTFSDMFLEMRCGFDNGGGVDFTGATVVDLTPTGLRDLQASSGAGTIEFDTSACYGEYAQVFVEIISAFDGKPILHDFDLVYDIDDDEDDKTVEGIYNPLTMAAGPATRVVNTADVHDDAFTWPSVSTLVDCVDTNAAIGAAQTYYTDADGDGEGTGAGSLLCPAAATGKVTNNTDCKDTGVGANTYSFSNGNGLRGTETTGAGLDFNCDGSVNCFRDADGDGDGSTTVVAKTGITSGGSATACVNSVIGGTANDSVDCNDNSDDFSFQAQAGRATETKTDGNDYNCDGSVSCFVDADNDDFGITTEIAVSVTAGGLVDCTASGRATVSTDCEDDVVDGGANIFPGATETTGSGQDRNCSGSIVCYQDNDLDGDGDENPATSTVSITVTAGTTVSCVRSAAQNAGATPASKPTSGNNLDCKDTGASANTYSTSNSNGLRGTETTGGGLDFNCDDSVLCYVDNDGDGDGSSTTIAKAVTSGGTATSCVNAVPGGTANDTGDCNDNSTSFRPNGAPAETPANGNDFNCDGSVSCFVDADGDDFGTTTALPVAVTAGGLVDCTALGRAVVSTDCEDDVVDSGALFFPGASETAGVGADRNCSASVACFVDNDADGDGDENPATATASITVTSGAVISCARSAVQNASGSTVPNKATSANATDCNDASNTFSFTAQASRLSETAGNGNDYNCDGTVQCFTDVDGDTYGTSATNVTISAVGVSFVNCADPANDRATRSGDCNDVAGVNGAALDNGELYNPDRVSAETTGNGNDFGCDGSVTCFQDLDADGFGTTTTVAVSVTAGGFADCTTSNRSAVSTDCNDVVANNGASFNTSETEVTGGGIDFNCGGSVVCFGDDDRDGEGEASQSVTVSVTAGGGSANFCNRIGVGVGNPTSANSNDCNDASNSFRAAITDVAETVGGTDFNCDGDVRCWPDVDGDGRGSDAVGVTPVTLAGAVTAGGTISCDNAVGGVADDQDDCDDTNVLTYLNAAEAIGDQTDFNCNGSIRCYADLDGDTWGSSTVTTVAVATDGGSQVCANNAAATRTGDCNDTSDPTDRFNPGSTEESVGGVETDYNCDATINCFLDSDRDGQGTSAETRNNITGVPLGSTAVCLTAQQRSSNSTDCDDADDDVRVGAPEVPGSGIDSNCDAVVQCFRDSDGDGYGALSSSVPGVLPRGVRLDCSLFGADDDDDCLDCFNVAGDGSCLDNATQRTLAAGANPDPAREEALDVGLIDEDCDGIVACYPDADRDGFGDEATVLSDPGTWALSNALEPTTNGQGQCLSSQAHAANGEDCHDDQSDFHPGASHFVSNTTYLEVASAGVGITQVNEIVGNAYDDNCDGVVSCFYDQDQDGYGIQQPVSNNPVDFRTWSGTLQPTPGAAGTFDRVLGGTYTCDAARFEAPLIAGPVFDCNDTNDLVFPDAPEADGQGDDNDCDAVVFCFIDADNDSYGGSTDDFAVPGGEKGYISGVDGPELCTTANGFADNGDDCHDNNRFANPSGVYAEVAGHTPEEGARFNVPGVGLREIGNGVGQFDYCGDGSDSCYNAAFDEDCDGEFDCYLDEDGDGWGTDLVQDTRPTNLGANPLLSCDRDASLAENRRAAVGSNSLDDPNRDCHPDVASAHPQRLLADGSPDPTDAPEVPGNAYDDNCDDIVACYQDLDNDDYGILDEVYVTWNGHPVNGVEGFTAGVTPDRGTFDCDAVANAAARRGSVANPSFDCHDNYQFANPGVISEVPGHTPADGETADVPGAGSVTVGTGGGEFDLCGDGSSTCYSAAFDEDCDGIVQCYLDNDGDGVGSALTNEAGIVPGEAAPHTVTGTTTDAYTVFTCNTTSVDALDADRRAAVGGGPGSAEHDCNDGNAGVYPTTEQDMVVQDAPAEVAGHTTNVSDGTSFAFDEDCDGAVDCFEDLDRDFYGTRVVTVQGSSGLISDETAAGTTFKRYDCETVPSGDRSFFAKEDGDCHDNNGDANPEGSEEAGTSVDPFTGGEAAFDEDCSGSFDCYRDRDDDFYGTGVFTVSRTNVVAGRTQLPGGSLYDDGVYTCELAVSDLTWAPGVEQTPLTGKGGEGSEDYDCHDRNGLANPGVTSDDPGNTLDSSGRDDRAYDDNCDGTVECFRNVDGDQFGTFTVALPTWDETRPLTGHVAQDPTGSFFICDSAARATAGRGGQGSVNFDCHDDSTLAYPGNGDNHYAAVVAEDPGDVYDNDCDGTIDCFEDLDNDHFGTRVVHKTPAFFAELISDQYNPASGRSEAASGMVLYACGTEGLDEAGITLSALELAALGFGEDEVAAIGGQRGDPDFNEETYDCHDNNPSANPGVSGEASGTNVDPRTGDPAAFDEDCNGAFTCWVDRDNDTFGTVSFEVNRDWYNGGQPNRLAGGSQADDGVYHCDLAPPTGGQPPNRTWNQGGGETHLAGTGGGSSGPFNTTFDCHDTNSLANPSRAEVQGDSVALVPDSATTYATVEGLSWDDNCDGIVVCYRDFDQDGFGTFERPLGEGAFNRDVDDTIARVPTTDYFECDNNGQRWAGKGGSGNNEFDCHDDYDLAFPGYPDGIINGDDTEEDGNAYDDDCDGFVNCFEDRDNDEYGTDLRPIAVSPSTGLTSPDFDGAAGFDAEDQGMLLYPCGEDSAEAANLILDSDPGDGVFATLRDKLHADRRAEKGGLEADGITRTADYDCHDNWSFANRGVGSEVPGDPFDNNCDGVIRCYNDNDGDGFGFSTTTVPLATATLALNPEIAFDFSQFPFEEARGDLTRTVLPAYPTQAYPEIATYLEDVVEQAARAGAATRTWYDCRSVEGASAVGGTDPLFLDCHDEEPLAHPGFVFASGQVDLIRPLERRLAVGPEDETCDGPIMCVVDQGGGTFEVLSRYEADDRATIDDECTVTLGGDWRCFEAQGNALATIGNRQTDKGEISGDAFDNDCDGVVMCYEDVDGDDIGTVSVVDDGAELTDPLWFGPHYSCTNAREARYTGDCHDHRASVKPANDGLQPDGTDLGDLAIEARGLAPVAGDGWDDEDCDGVVLCHIAGDNSIHDRYEEEDCEGTLGGVYRCYNREVTGNDLDEDCDGTVACFYDGDSDGYGVEQAKLADTSIRNPVAVPATGDLGTYSCAQPGFQTAGTTSQFDCNDANFFENPGGIETDDIFSGINPADRPRAYRAVGNTIDENCDGTVMCWQDLDGDNWGGGVLEVDVDSLVDPIPPAFETFWDGEGNVEWAIVASPDGDCTGDNTSDRIGDCHDEEPTAFPGHASLPGNGFDNDCDGFWRCYQDIDDDSYGSGVIVTSAPGDLDCLDEGEADDSEDCLDDPQLAGDLRYPIGANGRFDPTLTDDEDGDGNTEDPGEVWPTVAALSHPYPDSARVYEVYGDGFDEDCDGAELCFIDQDLDGYVDGTPQPGRSRDPLNRVGKLVENESDTPGVIGCNGVVLVDEVPVFLSSWPLEGILPAGDDPFVDPTTGLAVFDCNDDEPTVNPEADEIYYDAVDQNCDNRSDYDRDQDGYDDAAKTQERSLCPSDPSRRWQVDPVIGCGVGTDCDDSATTVGANTHRAPYNRTTVDAAARAQEQYGLTETPTTGPVVPYDFDEDGQADIVGVLGEEESCEASGQVDNDCDGNVNTSLDCLVDLWAYDTQTLLFQSKQQDAQRPWGSMSRELFTSCATPDPFNDYIVVYNDPLDYTVQDLENPAILAEATSRYIDFVWDPNWLPPAGTPTTKYYRDSDGDTEGDGRRQGVMLCDLSAEPPNLWISNRFDCNDGRPDIKTTGDEVCDRVDNNCNGEADEASLELNPEVDPSCVFHWIDSDSDSWGLEDGEVREGSTDRYCLCPRFEAVEVLEDGSVVDIEPPHDCEHYVNETQNTVFGHRIGGICYVRNDDDCDDLNFNIKPFAPGEEPYELIDGVDNDCNGELPVIELDCDDDNAYPYLPQMTEALVDQQGETPIENATSVGLRDCGGAPPDLVCWGERLPLSCDNDTKFWVVKTSVLEELEKFSGAGRVARQSSCTGWDCDDQCPKRCVGLDEGCDGIDNDCDQYADEATGAVEAGLIDDDLNGIPDAMQSDTVALGKVQPGELDLDGDAHVSCQAATLGRDNQTATTDRSCREYSSFLDCNDLCALSAPAGPEEEICNGFAEADLCDGTTEDDGDGDLYRSCGAFGPDAGAAEKIYVLLYSDGDIPAYLEKPDLNKLDTVVPLIPPRLYDDPAFENTSVYGDVRECDRELDRQLVGLVGDLPADDAGRREELLDLCVRADTCRVMRERIAAQTGMDQANDHSGDVIDRPEDVVAPAAPPTGINSLPEYCDGLENARCSVMELTLRNDKDEDMYDEADAWRKVAVQSTDTAVQATAANSCVWNEDFTDLYHPEQAVTRTVWSREQIVAARKLVVEYECYRMYGTFGCTEGRFQGAEGDPTPTWVSPYRDDRPRSEGYFSLPDVPIGIVNDNPEWWIYANRFSPLTIDGGGTLVGCWGDPKANDAFVDGAETINVVGGDCKSDVEDKERFEPNTAHRGAAEGPGDLVARYLGLAVDCTTCLDEVDNNCNTLIDADEPACAQCFVGQGYGCGCSAEGSRGRLGSTSTPVLVLFALMLVARRRREVA